MFSPTNPFRTIVRTPEAAAPAADAEMTDSTKTDAAKVEDAEAVVVTSSEEYLTEWWTTRVPDVFPPAYKITDHTSKVLEKVVDHLQPGCMVSPPSVLNMTRDRDEGPINSGLMEFTRKYIITDADRDLLRSATIDAWRLFPWAGIRS